MSKDSIRITFAITKDMEISLKKFKKEIFYDRSKSDMIRELVLAGMLDLEQKKRNTVIEAHEKGCV